MKFDLCLSGKWLLWIQEEMNWGGILCFLVSRNCSRQKISVILLGSVSNWRPTCCFKSQIFPPEFLGLFSVFLMIHWERDTCWCGGGMSCSSAAIVSGKIFPFCFTFDALLMYLNWRLKLFYFVLPFSYSHVLIVKEKTCQLIEYICLISILWETVTLICFFKKCNTEVNWSFT